MEKKYQVFISSTYDDLRDERGKVQDTILSMYHFPIGMEMFSAADEEQWEIIQETIDSSDYYVLIVGHRYGSVIQEGEYAGISYTQKEFRYALEKKIPVLAFLIDKSVPVTPDKMEEDADKRAKLEEFKSEVMQDRLVQWWTSSEDLANKVMNSLNKQINRGKRPGWIRADAVNLERTQEELVEMSKKIRQLEEENSELRKHVAIRKPELVLEINGADKLEIPFWEGSDSSIECDYMELSMEDVPDEAKDFITQEMLDHYNQTLPDKEVIEEYKRQMRFCWQAQECPFEIDLKISNDGNMKAKDIYAEICFPDELVLFKKNKVTEIPFPERPKKGINPIETFYKGRERLGKGNCQIASTRHFGGSLIDLDALSQVDASNRHYCNDDNSISIRMSDLMTGYAWSIEDKYVLLPREKGTFEIKYYLMCEEYEESLETSIQVIVK